MAWTPVDRFPEHMSDAYIDERIGRSPKTLTDLSTRPAIEAGEELSCALESIVVPTAQMRFVLRIMTSKARAYARHAYSDEPTFLRRTYSDEKVSGEMRITFLTSLAGAGKTVTLNSFQRLHQDTRVELPGHADLRLKAAWLLTAENGASAKKLLLPHFRHNSDESRKSLTFAKVNRECSTQGVALLLGDEFQFISRNNGSALAANAILKLTKIGPPVFIATNYSLLHSFMRRNQEDRQRFFSDILEMHPEPRNSKDWEAIVRGALRVATEFHFLLDDPNVYSELHVLTFGIDRLLAILLRHSYFAMRERSASHVTIEDIRIAYGSIHYAASRSDICQLEAGILNPKALPSDLCCPVSATPCHARTSENQDDIEKRSDATQAELISSMNANESAAARNSSKASEATNKRPAKPAYSADSLINASHRFGKD